MDKAAVAALVTKSRALADNVARGWEARAESLAAQAAGLYEQATQCRSEADRERAEVEALAKALDCCADPTKPPCSPCEEARRAREAATAPDVLPPTQTVDSSAAVVAHD